MRRIVIVACLIAGLLAQGFALAGKVSALGADGGPVHAAMHLDSVAHHHDHDGSLHKDGSMKSRSHLQAECCFQPAGVPPEGMLPFPSSPRVGPLADDARDGHDSPFLEGLKRPPRPRA